MVLYIKDTNFPEIAPINDIISYCPHLAPFEDEPADFGTHPHLGPFLRTTFWQLILIRPLFEDELRRQLPHLGPFLRTNLQILQLILSRPLFEDGMKSNLIWKKPLLGFFIYIVLSVHGNRTDEPNHNQSSGESRSSFSTGS